MAEISNLVLHAKCNDDAANTIVTDDSPTANNGTLQGGDNTQDITIAGKINAGFHLNGSDDDLKFLDNAAYDETETISWFGWYWFDTVGSGEVLAHKYNTAGFHGREWLMQLRTVSPYKKLSISFGDPASGTFEGRIDTDNDVIDTAGWYWAGFTYDTGTVLIYVNNVSVPFSVGSGAVPTTLFNGAGDVYVGQLNGGSYLDGIVDDQRFYTKVLSSEERDFIYNGGAGTESNDMGGGGSVLIWEPEFCVMNGGFDV